MDRLRMLRAGNQPRLAASSFQPLMFALRSSFFERAR